MAVFILTTTLLLRALTIQRRLSLAQSIGPLGRDRRRSLTAQAASATMGDGDTESLASVSTVASSTGASTAVSSRASTAKSLKSAASSRASTARDGKSEFSMKFSC